jgi:hypothetical protein
MSHTYIIMEFILVTFAVVVILAITTGIMYLIYDNANGN